MIAVRQRRLKIKCAGANYTVQDSKVSFSWSRGVGPSSPIDPVVNLMLRLPFSRRLSCCQALYETESETSPNPDEVTLNSAKLGTLLS